MRGRVKWEDGSVLVVFVSVTEVALPNEGVERREAQGLGKPKKKKKTETKRSEEREEVVFGRR